MSRSGSTFGKVVAWLVAVLLIVCVVFVGVYFGLRSQGKTFYVEYDGQRYPGNSDAVSLWLAPSDKHEFSVKSLTGGEVDYSVKVTSNVENNFRFTVGTEMYRLYNDNAELDDYSDMFGLTVSATGFSLTIPQDMSVENVLEQRYGGSITPMDYDITEYTDYFAITVTVDNSTVILPFNSDPMQVSLDNSQFIVGDTPMSEVPHYPIFALYYSDSIDCWVYAELPNGAYVGEKVDFTIDYDPAECEITRVVLLDEQDKIISELQAQDGVYSFFMPAEIASIWVYSVSK